MGRPVEPQEVRLSQSQTQGAIEPKTIQSVASARYESPINDCIRWRCSAVIYLPTEVGGGRPQIDLCPIRSAGRTPVESIVVHVTTVERACDIERIDNSTATVGSNPEQLRRGADRCIQVIVRVVVAHGVDVTSTITDSTLDEDRGSRSDVDPVEIRCLDQISARVTVERRSGARSRGRG